MSFSRRTLLHGVRSRGRSVSIETRLRVKRPGFNYGQE